MPPPRPIIFVLNKFCVSGHNVLIHKHCITRSSSVFLATIIYMYLIVFTSMSPYSEIYYSSSLRITNQHPFREMFTSISLYGDIHRFFCTLHHQLALIRQDIYQPPCLRKVIFRGGHVSPLGYITTNTTYFRLQLFGEVIEYILLASGHIAYSTFTNYTLSPGRSTTVLPVTDPSTTGITSLGLHTCFIIIALRISS